MKPTISVTEEITMITLQNISADMNIIADIFEKIAQLGIDIDIISLSPVQSSKTSLTFTIKDEDLIRILEFTSSLSNGKIKTIVCSGNYIISIFAEEMENTPGIASKIFRAVADAHTDVRVISTSEVQISILVTSADFQDVNTAINNCVANM